MGGLKDLIFHAVLLGVVVYIMVNAVFLSYSIIEHFKDSDDK